MAPIRAILCGREPKLVEFMKSNLAPKIESESMFLLA